MLFFLLFFFLSLIGDDWLGSLPAAPSRASGDREDGLIVALRSALLKLPPYLPTLCALVDSEDGQRWSPLSPPAGRSSVTERLGGHSAEPDRKQEVTGTHHSSEGQHKGLPHDDAVGLLWYLRLSRQTPAVLYSGR